MSEKLVCAFCGHSKDEVGRVVKGKAGVYICEACVELAHGALYSEPGKKQQQKGRPRISSMRGLPKPSQIRRYLDHYVVGQESAKKLVSVAVYNHYKRLVREHSAQDDGIVLQKSNILLVGPTGTGKTLLAQSLANFLEVPFTIADATSLTEAGYVGDDVETILARLLQAAGDDIAAASRGIIYVDEIDKIARKTGSPSLTRDVSGEGVQQALLKILEGTVARVPPRGGRKHPQQDIVQIDTKDILFICGGTFDGLEEIVAKRVGRGAIGFDYPAEHLRAVHEHDDEATAILPVDLVHYGLLPEFVGRLPVLARLSDLDEKAFEEILMQPKNALYKQYRELLAMDRVDLEFSEAATKAIVKKAKRANIGARALRLVLESIMQEPMYRVPDMSDVCRLRIGKNVVEKGASPTYIRKQGARAGKKRGSRGGESGTLQENHDQERRNQQARKIGL